MNCHKLAVGATQCSGKLARWATELAPRAVVLAHRVTELAHWAEGLFYGSDTGVALPHGMLASRLDGDFAEVLEPRTKAGHERGALCEGHGAEVVKRLGNDRRALLLDDAHDVVHKQVIETDM